jgi:hypothetical protein
MTTVLQEVRAHPAGCCTSGNKQSAGTFAAVSFASSHLRGKCAPPGGLKTADAGFRCAAAPVGQILDAGGNAARSIDLHAAHE